MRDLAQVGLGPRPFARWSEPREDAVVPTELPESARAWLSQRLGRLEPSTPVPEESVTVPPSALPLPAHRHLAAAVGTEYVDDSPATRLAHAGGQSYRDLVRRRRAMDIALPDAVVSPASHEEVEAVLRVCHDHRVAVVPYGGGTSVVGGVEPTRNRHYGVISLDLTLMDQLLGLSSDDQTATFQPGVIGPRVERLLRPHGFTLGHVPQSFARATLGGYVATRSVGQASTGYGRIDDMVVALRVATPAGTIQLGTGTPNAAGPDLRALFVGSEGTLGVITEITLRVHQAPAEQRYEMWALPSFSQGLDCLRALEREDAAPDVVRLSDEDETEVTRVLGGRAVRSLTAWLRLRRIHAPTFLVAGWEGGQPRSVRARRSTGRQIMRRHGGAPLGKRAGEAWHSHRFDGPHQRDTLLDEGILVETLETATTWSKLPSLYAAVRSALVGALTEQETPPIVMTHVSHVYPTGASLYVTVLARQLEPPSAALQQWELAKAASCAVIADHGATISHHHAVGRDHAPYLGREIGDIGLRTLSAAKAELDPRDVLNPGVLLPGRASAF